MPTCAVLDTQRYIEKIRGEIEILPGGRVVEL